MRVTNLLRFKADLSNFAKVNVPNATLKVQRAVALQVLNGFILRSPVDTGRFRASWTAQAGSPNPVYAVEGLDTYPSPNANVLLASSGLSRPFMALYVNNNLPYALRLEEGHSGQAPAGIVAPTVAGINLTGVKL